ncbi:MAG: hypothetical protein SVK08_09830 [Halobacteriota archaeon]|nr:hypothetical protein [Halobacteriota archaeon]
MQLDEINEQKWKVSEDLCIEFLRVDSLGLFEQENHIVEYRAGLTNESEREVHVDCTDQGGITKYAKSEFFTLTGVTVSSTISRKDFVLGVRGQLEPKGLTIRSKKRVYTEEEKKVLSDRMKKVRGEEI